MATMHVYEEKRESHRIVGDTWMVNLGYESIGQIYVSAF